MFAAMLVGMLLRGGALPVPRLNKSPLDWHLELTDEATQELKVFNFHQSTEVDFKGLHCTMEADGVALARPITNLSIECSMTSADGTKATASFYSGPCIWPTPAGFFPIVIYGGLRLEGPSSSAKHEHWSVGINATCKAGESETKAAKPTK